MINKPTKKNNIIKTPDKLTTKNVEDCIRRLQRKGKKTGFVTFDTILDCLPYPELYIEALDKFFDYCGKHNI